MVRSVTAGPLRGIEMLLERTLAMVPLVLAGCVAGRAGEDPAFRERLLATVAEDAGVVVPAAFSADGRKAAWVMRRDGMSRAVCGAWMGNPFGVVC